MNKKVLNKQKSTPESYGKDHAVTLTKASLIKLEENSGNLTIDAYNAKVGQLTNDIQKSLHPVNERQMAFILDQVARRQPHGFEYLSGNEKKLNVDKVLKLNASLTSEQLAMIDKTIATRKELAKGGSNPVKKAASALLASKHSDLVDLPKLRYKGDNLRMITESECQVAMVKKLASGKALMAISG